LRRPWRWVVRIIKTIRSPRNHHNSNCGNAGKTLNAGC
jgi:hypothetical protein